MPLKMKSYGFTTKLAVAPRTPFGSSAFVVVSSFMPMLIRPTSLYFAVTAAWPFVNVTFCAAEAPSLVAALTVLTVTLRVPVAGLLYVDQNFRLLVPVYASITPQVVSFGVWPYAVR